VNKLEIRNARKRMTQNSGNRSSCSQNLAPMELRLRHAVREMIDR